MLKRFLIISVIFIIIPASNSYSQDVEDRIKGSIIVTSETLTADNKARTALFETNVITKTPDMTLYADRMLVHYKEDGGDVTKIEAAGNVKLYKDTRLITSEEATYYADKEKVIFTGKPRAVDGENVITGTKMTFFIIEDRFNVENSKVFLKNKKDR